LLPREPDDRGEEGLADAVRHVHLLRLTPFGDDVAVMDDQAVERRADAVRAEDRVERLVRGEGLLMDNRLVVRRGIVAGDGELDRLAELRRVEPFLLRRVLLPVEAARVIRGGLRRRRRGAGEEQREGETQLLGHARDSTSGGWWRGVGALP